MVQNKGILTGRESLLSVYELTFLIALLAFGAGFPGSLTGMGGGIVIVPGLALRFGIDIRHAIGAAFVSVDCDARCACRPGRLCFSQAT